MVLGSCFGWCSPVFGGVEKSCFHFPESSKPKPQETHQGSSWVRREHARRWVFGGVERSNSFFSKRVVDNSPRKLTNVPWKIVLGKRSFPFLKWPLFRGHVSVRGCKITFTPLCSNFRGCVQQIDHFFLHVHLPKLGEWWWWPNFWTTCNPLILTYL